jgi:hypothetical protein
MVPLILPNGQMARMSDKVSSQVSCMGSDIHNLHYMRKVSLTRSGEYKIEL